MKRLLPLIIFFIFLSTHVANASVVNRSSNSVVTRGLVGYWTFDGKDIASGMVKDLSGFGNHGNFINIATSTFYTNGKIGQAGNFDGNNDRVSMGAPPSLNNLHPITISAWIKPRSYGGSSLGVIAAKTNGGSSGWFFEVSGISGHSALRFDVGLSGTPITVNTADSVTSLNEWQHAVITWDGGTAANGVHIYKNGVETSYGTVSDGSGSQNDDSSWNLTIGALSAGTQEFDGLIDDVHIYNRVLSASEIITLYSEGAAGKMNVSPVNTLARGLLGYWTFDGKDTTWGGSNVTADRSGNGNTGTLFNVNKTTSPAAGRFGQALTFSGNTEVDVGSSNFFGTSPLTISAWIYPKSFGGLDVGAILDDGNVRLRVNSGNSNLQFSNANFGGSGGAVSANNAVVLNKWSHVLVTRNASGVTNIYVNGELSGATNQDGGTVSSTGNTIALGNNASSLVGFDGYMDEFRVYNRVLSTNEIRELYSQGQGKQNVSTANVLTSGLVGYWTFDGKDSPGGRFLDKSGNDRTGYAASGFSTSTAYASGKIGQAINFSLPISYIDIPSAPSVTPPYTISSWFYPQDITNTQGIVVQSLGTLHGVFLQGNTLIIWQGSNFRGSCNHTFTSNELNYWHQATIVINSSSNPSLWKCYLDGSDVGVSTIDNTSYSGPGSTDWTIGAYFNNSYWFQGKIDEVRVYNRSLSATEALQLYNLGK